MRSSVVRMDIMMSVKSFELMFTWNALAKALVSTEKALAIFVESCPIAVPIAALTCCCTAAPSWAAMAVMACCR